MLNKLKLNDILCVYNVKKDENLYKLCLITGNIMIILYRIFIQYTFNN